MKITYEEAKLAQKNHQEEFLKNPHVVSFGVVADTDSAGRKTGDFAKEI